MVAVVEGNTGMQNLEEIKNAMAGITSQSSSSELAGGKKPKRTKAKRKAKGKPKRKTKRKTKGKGKTKTKGKGKR